MTRSFYSDYVNHCIRYYVRTDGSFRSNADKENWQAVDEVMSSYSDEDAKLIRTIYKQNGCLSDTVTEIATGNGASVDKIWHLIKDFERKVAKRRGLL